MTIHPTAWFFGTLVIAVIVVVFVFTHRPPKF